MKNRVLLEFKKGDTKYRIVEWTTYQDDDESPYNYWCRGFDIDVIERNNMKEKVWRKVNPEEWYVYNDVIEYLVENFVLQKPQEPQQATPEV